LQAVADRPIFGWGLGRFRAATPARFSPEFVKASAFDDLGQAWFDAHNVFINVAVGIGVVGLVIVVVWLGSAALGVSGPLVFPLLALGSTLLLQPAGLALLPVGMLMLGSAASGPRVPRRHAPPTVALVALLPGVVLAGWLAIGDLRLSRAVEARDVVAIEDGARWFPDDAVVADVVAQSWFLRSLIVPGLQSRAIEWSQRAVDAEPDRPYLVSEYALRLLAYEQYADARQQIDRALELQPWHLRSWFLAYALADRTGDQALKEEAVEPLCRLGADIPEC
jgi:O-antigen ligase